MMSGTASERTDRAGAFGAFAAMCNASAPAASPRRKFLHDETNARP